MTELFVEVEVKIVNNNGFLQFFENNILKAAVDTHIYPRTTVRSPSILKDTLNDGFVPPTFGITFLGTR